jgi:hypothetical protein
LALTTTHWFDAFPYVSGYLLHFKGLLAIPFQPAPHLLQRYPQVAADEDRPVILVKSMAQELSVLSTTSTEPQTRHQRSGSPPIWMTSEPS